MSRFQGALHCKAFCAVWIAYCSVIYLKDFLFKNVVRMHEAEYDTVKVCINVFCMDVVRNDGYPSGLSEYQPAFPLYQIRPQVFEYSIPDKQYTEWSRTIQKQGFHHLWLQRDTPITHISFHLKRPMHILLHDAYMFCIIDKSLVSSSLLPPVLSLILPYLESSSSKSNKVQKLEEGESE